MRYKYHDLHDWQFEDLVLQIGAELLAPGVQPFSNGAGLMCLGVILYGCVPT